MSVGAPAPAFARRVLEQLFAKLTSIDESLVRMLELAQAPREGLMTAGTTPFGGQVGVTPSSCTVIPPAGMPPGVVLGAHPHRRGLAVQNLSAAGGATLTLGLGLTSPQSGIGLTLAPGGSWDGRISGAVWTGSVSVVASEAGCAFAGLELLGRSERPSRPLNRPL